MSNERILRLSEIADTIEYLELKTPDDIIITFIMNVFFVEDFILVHCRDGVFKFTQNGDFITRIGSHGQGPGDHLMTYDIAIDRKRKQIIHSDIEQVIFYDYDGNVLRCEKWGTHVLMGFSDSIIWAGNHTILSAKNKLYAINQDHGDTLVEKANTIYGEKSLNPGITDITPKRAKEFYYTDNDLFFVGRMNNDTIFKLSGISCTPYAIIDLGKYKIPRDYEPWYSYEYYEKKASDYCGIYAACEDENYLFIPSVRWASIPGDREFKDEDYYRYFLYDKHQKIGYNIKDKIIDNISGGPNIWPEWILNGYYISAIEWYDLSEEIKSGDYNLSDAVKRQFSKFNYNTNELLIMCKIKNN